MSDPISPEYREQMNALAKLINTMFEGAGFALLIFDKTDPARANYISNAQREDMLVAMKEFIARNEGRVPPETGAVQ